MLGHVGVFDVLLARTPPPGTGWLTAALQDRAARRLPWPVQPVVLAITSDIAVRAIFTSAVYAGVELGR
jgi:hypothetical protein